MLLFDLAKDPYETTDLAAQQPDRVTQMTAGLEAWRTSALRSLAGADYGPGVTIAPAGRPKDVDGKTKRKNRAP